jgi:DNA repair protein RadC
MYAPDLVLTQRATARYSFTREFYHKTDTACGGVVKRKDTMKSKCCEVIKLRYAVEVKFLRLRETPIPGDLLICDTPERAAAYWQLSVVTAPWFNAEVESFVVLHLNSRRRVMHHTIASTGTLDTLLTHPREVFKAAILGNAAAIIIMHNHPSGDPTPSEADIKVTRDLIRAGQLLKIEVLDHVVMGESTPERLKAYVSLRELGYFFS